MQTQDDKSEKTEKAVLSVIFHILIKYHLLIICCVQLTGLVSYNIFRQMYHSNNISLFFPILLYDDKLRCIKQFRIKQFER